MIKRLAKVTYFFFLGTAGITLLVGLAVISGEAENPFGLFVFFVLVSLFFYAIGWTVRYIVSGDKSTIFSKIPSTGNKKQKYSVFILANIPVHGAFNKEEPFDLAHEAQNISENDEVQGLIFLGILSYQFFIYFEILKERFGEEIAQIAKQQMFITLNRMKIDDEKTSSGMGDQLKPMMNLIQKIYEADPFTQEINGTEITAPKEYMLAVGILNRYEQSPYYAGHQENQPVYDNELDFKFAEILAQAAEGIVNKYRVFLFSDAITLDESSVRGLKNKDTLLAA